MGNRIYKATGTEYTLKQERFAQYFVANGGNGSKAAREAGYSEDTAGAIAHENLKKPEIVERIQQLEKEQLDAARVTQESVVRQIARLGMSDMRDYYDEDGRLKRVEALSDEAAAAITSIKVIKTRNYKEGEGEPPSYDEVVEYKLADKSKSLEMLGKMHKLFTDRLELDAGEVNIIIGRQHAEED